MDRKLFAQAMGKFFAGVILLALLLFVPAGESEGRTDTLEGDHFETPNVYRAWVYYRGPNDRYDRLVATAEGH